MNAPTSDISDLVSLIANAATSLQFYYNSNPAKPYVPSLDDTEPHPLDSEFYPLDVRKSVQILEGACAQLCATLVRPNHTVLNRHLNIYQSACISVALRARIADILLDKPDGLPVSEISKQCDIEHRKLARVLRVLCSQHIFREVSKDVFANNRLSMMFLASEPLSSMGWHLSAEPSNRATVCLADTLLDPEWGHSYAPEHSPFSRAYGMPLWAYLDGKDNTERAEQASRFGRAMIGWNTTVDAAAITTRYPWDRLPQGAVVNDVAGGVGHIAMQLYKRYPNLNLKLQDFPETLQQAQEKIWPKECPEAIANGKVEFKAVDILVEPPIANCDIYLLKNVIHAMADADATATLSNIRKVMSPHSRILCQELILQGASHDSDDESAFQKAPAPLLPNYGVGRIRQYHLDAVMMTNCNSEERSLDGYVRLAAASGLRLTNIWDLGEASAIELEPVLEKV